MMEFFKFIGGVLLCAAAFDVMSIRQILSSVKDQLF
jgi:hypothetical protein